MWLRIGRRGALVKRTWTNFDKLGRHLGVSPRVRDRTFVIERSHCSAATLVAPIALTLHG